MPETLDPRKRVVGQTLEDASGKWWLVAHTDHRGSPSVVWVQRPDLQDLQWLTGWADEMTPTGTRLRELLNNVVD